MLVLSNQKAPSNCEDNDNKLKNYLDKSISEIMNMNVGNESVAEANAPFDKRLKLKEVAVQRNQNYCKPNSKADYE